MFSKQKAKPKAAAKGAKAAATKPKKAAAPKATAKKPAAKPKATKKRANPDSEDEGESLGHSDHDNTLLSVTPPSAKKVKKAPVTKKAAGKPLASLENDVPGLDGTNESGGNKKDVGDKYQKASQQRRWSDIANIIL